MVDTFSFLLSCRITFILTTMADNVPSAPAPESKKSADPKACVPEQIRHYASTERPDKTQVFLAVQSLFPAEGSRTSEEEMAFNLLTGYSVAVPTYLFHALLVSHMKKSVCKDTMEELKQGAKTVPPEYSLNDLNIQWSSSPEKLKILVEEVLDAVRKTPNLPDILTIQRDKAERRRAEEMILRQLGIEAK